MELSINSLIKIIIGVLVFVAVVIGLYLFFKEQFIDFFNNFVPEKSEFILMLLK